MPSLVDCACSVRLRKYRTRLCFVAAHLHRQGFRALESFLVAQLGDELDVEPTSIQIGVEIEQMRLEQQLPAAQRGPRAEARNAGPPAVVGAGDSHGKDAVQRTHEAAERHV